MECFPYLIFFCAKSLSLNFSLSNSCLRVFLDHHVSTKSSQRTLARRNIEEQEVPNAPDVQPQGEVTNAKFWEAIRMLSQVVTNQVWQMRGSQKDGEDT